MKSPFSPRREWPLATLREEAFFVAPLLPREVESPEDIERDIAEFLAGVLMRPVDAILAGQGAGFLAPLRFGH